MLETAPFLIYKRREAWRERGSRVVEDEVLSDCRPNASPPPFSTVSSLQVSGGSRYFEESLCAFGSTSILSPMCVRLTGVDICIAVLIGCNHPSFLHIHINIHILMLFALSPTQLVSSALSGRFPVCFFFHTCVSVSLGLSLPFLTYSSVQNPGGPALFSMHAHSYAKYLVNPT